MNFTLPEPVSVTFDPTIQQTITVEEDLIVTIPANTMATSGQVTLTIDPVVELPEQSDAKITDFGYEMKATSQDGEQITNFSGSITVEDHFSDTALDDLNVTNDNEVGASYYSESTGTWEELTYTVDEDENTVTYQTNHFTKFALVSASDTTPPSSPTNIAATGGDSEVTLTWTNPTDTDLAGIKIYRSTVYGTLGDIVTTIANTNTTSFENTGLTNWTTYYYTIKAYDVSSNLSTNTGQISKEAGQVSATPGVLPEAGRSGKIIVLLLLAPVCLVGIWARARFHKPMQ